MARNRRNRAEQSRSHDQAIQSRHHGCVILFSFFALFSREEHYTSCASSLSSLFGAVIKEELSTKHWAPIFRTKSFKSDVVTTLFNSPALFRSPRQAISDIASTPKSSARDTLFQATTYCCLFSHYSSNTPHDFDNKR